MGEQIDLSKLSGSLTVRPETEPELLARLKREELELHARLQQEEREHQHKLHTQRVTFYALGGAYLAALTVSFGVVLISSDAELRKWAMSLATSLLAALVGYVTGKLSK